MNREHDEAVILYCQNLGYSRNLILQAWAQYQGNEGLFFEILYSLWRRERQITKISPNYPKIKVIPKSTLLKKLPRMHHLKLKFEGNKALDFLELRKLGIFSKKTFRNAKGLSLEYIKTNRSLQNKHVSILANHLNRGLRRLNHLSIDLESPDFRSVNMVPLFKSIKQTFVSLVSLKLSLKEYFRISKWELLSFKKLFSRIRPTLKHLDLDFKQNYRVYEGFSDDLGMIIIKNLHKLETLSLNFSFTSTSTRIVHLLISAASTHLTKLKGLYLSVEDGFLERKAWNLPKNNLRSNLQELKLNFDNCKKLNLTYLWRLQENIVKLCPGLKELYFSARNDWKLPNKFYPAFEKGFLEKLNLNKFRFLYQDDIKKTLDTYQDTEDIENQWIETQGLEQEQIMQMEEEVEKVRQWARGEDEVHLYYKTLMEENQELREFEENEFFQENAENQFFEEEVQDDFGDILEEHDEDVFWVDQESFDCYGDNEYGEYDDDFGEEELERRAMEEEEMPRESEEISWQVGLRLRETEN